MPRGCDNPKSLFNNRPSAAPWTWSVKRTFSDGTPMSWKSSRHDIEVMRDGQRYVLTFQGRDMRGPKGRVRWFKSFGAAQVAADWERGL
jgi:hypothetical protein